MHPDRPAAGDRGAPSATVAGSVAGPEGNLPHRPHRVQRIPGDAPLVVRVRVGRSLAFAGGIHIGLPALALVVMLAWLVSNMLDPWSMLPSAAKGGFVTVLFVGGFNAFIWIVISLSHGPQLAADLHGVWVQARRWRTRSAFVPWEAVDRIYVRRNRRMCGLAQLVCVRTVVPHADHHLRAGLDARTQRMLFGATFNASLFLSGWRVDDVLAKLSQLSGQRLRIGSPKVS